MFTKTNDTKIEELRRQLEAAEAEKKAADKAEETTVRKAKKVAGDNHTRLALSLYKRLGIEPEHPSVRIIDGKKTTVAVDKDERLRTERLYNVIEAIIDKADPALIEKLTTEDRKGRDERKPETKKASTKPAVGDGQGKPAPAQKPAEGTEPTPSSTATSAPSVRQDQPA